VFAVPEKKNKACISCHFSIYTYASDTHKIVCSDLGSTQTVTGNPQISQRATRKYEGYFLINLRFGITGRGVGLATPFWYQNVLRFKLHPAVLMPSLCCLWLVHCKFLKLVLQEKLPPPLDLCCRQRTKDVVGWARLRRGRYPRFTTNRNFYSPAATSIEAQILKIHSEQTTSSTNLALPQLDAPWIREHFDTEMGSLAPAFCAVMTKRRLIKK